MDNTRYSSHQLQKLFIKHIGQVDCSDLSDAEIFSFNYRLNTHSAKQAPETYRSVQRVMLQ